MKHFVKAWAIYLWGNKVTLANPNATPFHINSLICMISSHAVVAIISLRVAVKCRTVLDSLILLYHIV